MLFRSSINKVRQSRRHKYRVLNTIEVDARRVLSNLRLFRLMNPGYVIIPVLKGNAYGHGLEQLGAILDTSSCQYIAVDGYFEAATLRTVCRQPILVMGYIAPENVRLVDYKRCAFVVQDKASLQAFGGLGVHVRIHLELNTGMNRLGLAVSELDEYLAELKKYPKLQLEGVMTHLADADNAANNTANEKQLRRFDRSVKKILEQGYSPKLIHIAQTAGSTKVRSKYANAVRIGIGTYGINPLAVKDPRYAQLSKLQPALELKSTIIKVIELKKGDRVSYNGTFTAPKAMRIGVLPIGYYEGLPRALSNRGCVTHGQTVLPIVGRVCMNHVMIDLRKSTLEVGDTVTVISKRPSDPNSVTNIQSQQQIFSYNLLTGLNESIRRTII